MRTPLTIRKAEDAARSRARRRAEGLTAIEAVLHRDDVAVLDELKAQIGAVSRSEILRVLIAKVDRASLSPTDLADLPKAKVGFDTPQTETP